MKPEYIKTTNKERKAEAARNAIVLPVAKQKPTPAHVKLAKKLRGADLTTLKTWENRLFRAGVFYTRAFTEWRNNPETPEALTDAEWPDRGNLIGVAKCYDEVIGVIRKRGIEFSPRAIVMPGTPDVMTANELPAVKMPVLQAVKSRIERWAGKFFKTDGEKLRAKQNTAQYEKTKHKL